MLAVIGFDDAALDEDDGFAVTADDELDDGLDGFVLFPVLEPPEEISPEDKSADTAESSEPLSTADPYSSDKSAMLLGKSLVQPLSPDDGKNASSAPPQPETVSSNNKTKIKQMVLCI